MSIKGFIRNAKFQKYISWILIAAMVCGLWVSGNSLHVSGPKAPLPDDEMQILADLNLGEDALKAEQMDELDENADRGGQSDQEQQEEQEKTDQPEQQEEQEQPDQPDEPEQPEEPKQPDQPDEPEQPDEPDEPDQPDEPEQKPDDSEQQPENTTPDGDTSDENTEEPGTGDGNQGQEDGIQGEQGGETAELSLGMVMTWQKYGKHPRTIVCSPSNTVRGSINTAQLVKNELEYDFALAGEEASHASITKVWMKAGDEAAREIDQRGHVEILLDNEAVGRIYTFQIETLWKGKDGNGRTSEQQLTFTYEIHFAYALDLELELNWQKADKESASLRCMANKAVAKTIESYELAKGAFTYTPKLSGSLAKDAKFVSGEYSTASGKKGTLDPSGGTLTLEGVGKDNQDTYYLTFTAEVIDEDGILQTVIYRITILYVETVDVQLGFTWLEKGTVPRDMICQADGTVSTTVKNNQLSAGAVKYEMKLIGNDSDEARILSISYTSEGSDGGSLAESGALPLILPKAKASNTYEITAVVLHGGKKLKYQIYLRYVMDTQLELIYTIKEGGGTLEKSILCENGKTKTAEAIYDDQLTKGVLPYSMVLKGEGNLEITSVKCYQSGSGKVISLQPEGQLTLLLNNGKTGENTFTVMAKDDAGTEYVFYINMQYKHRGQNNIKITTNMTNGQTIVNETSTNFNVKAWSEDESGKVVSYIPANGVDTKLIVKLDGETLKYVSTSGASSEFILYPKNPPKGDKNDHTIYVYAEDAYGNYGELTLNLKGQRKQAGQKKGKATIRIDMTVLGLGVVETMSYDVLADEPISYSVAKAVLGEDTGDPFGAAKDAMGWGGRYTGTLDVGFYLQSLTPGLSANGLMGSSWNKYGKTEKEVLAAIDDEFGKGTGLATLWRCIYRNGLNKSSGTSGSYGEFDFTSGSGWLFSLDGTYYPGLAMSEYSLEDGDVLTLRYTLAHGWDVGGGTKGYGNTVGYCVTALDGKYYIKHQMEHKTNTDGTKRYVCRCCGLEEGCLHENLTKKNLGDGTHITYCGDCQTEIGDPELHNWDQTAEAHRCNGCDAGEEHRWKEKEGSDTATCTEGGRHTVFCTVCNMTKEEDSPAKGHKLNNRWNHNKTEHYQKCSVCKEVIESSKGSHQYGAYDADFEDWFCVICDAGHDWDYCGNGDNLVIVPEETTCQHAVYRCTDCGLRLEKDGVFEDYHNYTGGVCICGKSDPAVLPEEETVEITEQE